MRQKRLLCTESSTHSRPRLQPRHSSPDTLNSARVCVCAYACVRECIHGCACGSWLTHACVQAQRERFARGARGRRWLFPFTSLFTTALHCTPAHSDAAAERLADHNLYTPGTIHTNAHTYFTRHTNARSMLLLSVSERWHLCPAIRARVPVLLSGVLRATL